MTDKTALRQLIEAVEAGELGWNSIATMAEDAGIGLRESAIAASAYSSLDAAKALFDALLPAREYQWHVSHEANLDGFVCNIFGCKQDRYVALGHAQQPAPAFLIAILKALEAQQ